MKRKYFLRNAALASLSSVIVTDVLSSCYRMHRPQPEHHDGKVLVLIQLDGGNDGLNTVIPLDQYANLKQARANIMIPEKKVLQLHDDAKTGLHPALADLHKMYNDKHLTIIQGVGMANPDLSHFKAIDIWNSGSDAPGIVSTGWLGRYFDEGLQGAHQDPPAIQVGASISKSMQGHEKCVGMAVGLTPSTYELQVGHYGPEYFTSVGKKLSYLRSSVIESKECLQKVRVATTAQKNLSSRYPETGKNDLADQLRIVAQLIGGGLRTKVYVVTLLGFDTHDKQVDPSDTTQGGHADLLTKLNEAVAAFEDDLHLMGKQDDVLGMTFSEFGRRIKSNNSYGCDHGTAAPMLLFGSKLKGGIVGKNPQISASVGVNDNLELQHDFRSVYASVMKGWFGSTQAKIDNTLFGNYPALNLFA